MTFTKTSQKFGQWADSRANTVFGLGFASEQQLSKVRANTFWNHKIRFKTCWFIQFSWATGVLVHNCGADQGSRWKKSFPNTFNDKSVYFFYCKLTKYCYIFVFQFSEKFEEVKDAAKLARDKSQEKGETLSNNSQVKKKKTSDF